MSMSYYEMAHQKKKLLVIVLGGACNSSVDLELFQNEKQFKISDTFSFKIVRTCFQFPPVLSRIFSI